MSRKINITHLLEGGKRLDPFDLIIDYRFISDTNLDVIVKLYGTTNNLGYTCLGSQVLFKPTIWNEFNTDIFMIKPKLATGMWVEIENAEFLEVKRIAAIYNESSKLNGRDMYCADEPLEVVSLATDNGNPFVITPEVYLKVVCKGTPTHYQISTSPDFAEAVWVDYVNRFLYDELVGGYNKLYYRVKDADDAIDSTFIEIQFVDGGVTAWSDLGVNNFFYLKFADDIDVPSLGNFNVSISIISGLNGNKLTVTGVGYHDTDTLKVYCDITGQIAGITVINGQFSTIEYSTGTLVEYFAVQFFLPNTPYPVLPIVEAVEMVDVFSITDDFKYDMYDVLSGDFKEDIAVDELVASEDILITNNNP